MMQATDFEFRQRWWCFGIICAVSYSFLAVDHVPAGGRLADVLMAWTHWPESFALHVVFGAAAALMFLAALVRTWGSAYLGRTVVHDAALHGEQLRADGPYRHVRNPLYFGNVLMSVAMGLVAPVIGCAVMIAAMIVFSYRLIGREEPVLEAEQGERYHAFVRAVPRLWPSISARIPASGAAPDWINGLSAEAFFWSFALGLLGFAITLNILWFYAGLVASPALSWLAGLVLKPRA
ncbi:MAG TPA: methyltransferase [Bryobacteraceae bacterium]|nr:methyltransferase [Bryobacteraceae bacterium]